MADIISEHNHFVRYILKSNNVPSLIMKEAPIGWKQDDLELDRHTQYHGIFTQFSNTLLFINEAKNYIERDYSLNGINADLVLTKEFTKDVLIDGELEKEIKWVEKYSGIADYSTKKIKGNTLSMKFNSNKLAELIKSHETDEFEIERLDSIDEVILDKLILNKVELKGTNLTSNGESVVDLSFQTVNMNGIDHQGFAFIYPEKATAITKIISQGNDRHVSVDAIRLSGLLSAPSHMFFVDTISEGAEVAILSIKYNIKYKANSHNAEIIRLSFYKYEWNGVDEYNLIETNEIHSMSTASTVYIDSGDIIGLYNVELEYNQGLILAYDSPNPTIMEVRVERQDLLINTTSFFEGSVDLSFIFTHDLYERLLYIITGEKNRFYSKFFGRTELGYVQDGLSEDGNLQGGLIGNISGFYIRAFDPESEKYKSLKISLKNLIDSSKSTFALGVGIETVDLKERLRVEELKYFYRDETIIKLPFQITNEERTLDNNLFFSGTTIGFIKGGDYENEVGLDEPNTQTSTVTPIRKSKIKFKSLSKIRGDDTGLEIIRRKPQIQFPDEDTSEDEHNWWLDLKRTIGLSYSQVDWNDRLQKLPSGINSPETFRGMIFTPLRILFRHSWILRSGLEPYINKYIKYISSIANSTLSMLFINETIEYSENSDIQVNKLERSRFLPDVIKFNHPVDNDLLDLVFGTTKIIVNGEEEDVPNYYFKFEWINENEEIERGYLLNLKPKDKGSWKFQLANENIIT